MKRLCVLASGTGSNLQAIMTSTQQGDLHNLAEVVLVISNKQNASALQKAKAESIPAFFIEHTKGLSPEDYDLLILDKLQDHKIDLILLAGYLKILTKTLIQPYRNRILNIHPSLLPAFGGLGMYGIKVHEAVIQSKTKYSGCTVHLVNEDIDSGLILDQAIIKINQDDSPESLAAKILKEEHKIYPLAIKHYIEEQT